MNGVRSPILSNVKNLEVSNLEKDRKLAFQNSQRSHLNNKKRYDKNKREPNFKVGQLVYVQHGNALNRNKLSEIRTGPFKIFQRISNCLYKVDSGYQKDESNIYHVSKLFPVEP